MPTHAASRRIADRLILRALIEDGLPSRASLENWPIREPWEFARAVFDSIYRCPYEQKLAEPVFQNITKVRLKKALALGLDIQNRGLPALEPLLSQSALLRSDLGDFGADLPMLEKSDPTRAVAKKLAEHDG